MRTADFIAGIIIGMASIIFLILVAFLLWERWDSLASRTRRASRQGHDPNDSLCTFWAGDFSGVDLSAKCPVCRPSPSPN